MKTYLIHEAFKQLEGLESLNEEDFNLNMNVDDELDAFMKSYKDEDDEVEVIDVDSFDENDLEASYAGKLILDCSVCHSKIYKDSEDVELADDGTLVNSEEECPFCYSTDGFKVIGQVQPYTNAVEEEEEEVSAEDSNDEIDNEPLDDDIEVEIDGEDISVEDDVEDIDDIEESLQESIINEDSPSQMKKYYDEADPNPNRKITAVNNDTSYTHKSNPNSQYANLNGVTTGNNTVQYARGGEAQNDAAEAAMRKTIATKRNGGINPDELEGALRGGYGANNAQQNTSIQNADDFERAMRSNRNTNANTTSQPAPKSNTSNTNTQPAPAEKQVEKPIEKQPEQQPVSQPKEEAPKQDAPKGPGAGSPNYNDGQSRVIGIDGSRKTTDQNGNVTFSAGPDAAWAPKEGIYHANSNNQPGSASSVNTSNQVTASTPSDSLPTTASNVVEPKVETPKIETPKVEEPKVSNDQIHQTDDKVGKTPDDKPAFESLNEDFDPYKEAVNHFHMDLGRDPEDIDEVIEYMLNMGDIKEPELGDESDWDSIQAYNKWYDNIAYKVEKAMNESLTEDFESATITTDKETLSMNSNPDGGVSVTTSPIQPEEETIVPVSDDVVAQIMDTSEDNEQNEIPNEEISIDTEVDSTDEVDIPMEEIDEESIDHVSESYLKNVYENVNSFKTTSVKELNNKLFIEGVINFTSGNSKNTSFIYEASSVSSDGKLKFIGENTQISRGKKTFTLTGSMTGNKFIAESLNYNYRAKDSNGDSTRVYGTVKR